MLDKPTAPALATCVICTRAGLSEVATRVVALTWRVANADALLGAFLEGGVRTRALLRAQTPEAMATIRAALAVAAREFERDGALVLTAPAVLSSARL